MVEAAWSAQEAELLAARAESGLGDGDGEGDGVVDGGPVGGRGLQNVAGGFLERAGGHAALAHVVRAIAERYGVGVGHGGSFLI